jgi:8-oxo-dGTP pyrophosphatase MutT (NUDIX family)
LAKAPETLTRDEIEEAAALDGSKRSPNMRPKDAGTLIILDGKGADAKMLMGRRHHRHAFMPGLFVFPGGRVDRADGDAKTTDNLHPEVETRLLRHMKGRPTKRRARAVALATIRETYEEAGLLLGRREDCPQSHRDWAAFPEHGVAPSLGNLRLIARAITPPGRTRRFDAWFFAAQMDDIAHQLDAGPSGELEDLHWLTIPEAKRLELPVITLKILQELELRLTEDPDLTPGNPVPFYHLRGKTFLRDMI